MKRIIVLLLIALFSITLSGCGETPPIDETVNNYYVLPDLNGKTKDEIIDILERNNQAYIITEFEQELELYELQFIMYQNYDTGDIVNNLDEVEILIYPEFTGERTFIYLPDLEGLNREQILDYFDMYELNVSFSEEITIDEFEEDTFAGYGSFYEIGDKFYLSSNVPIIIYAMVDELSEYFFPIEMEYDGPYLSEVYQNIDPIDPRGGYFEVDLGYCTDGDTAVFDYPTEIYNAILSGSKSTRFLNMDTEETYSGGEEEWGKSGSVYTCSLLESAKSIILQTDPGDSLTGTYGRLLAWVWVKLPGEDEYFLLNYMVVKQGLAQVKYEFGAGLDLTYGDYTYNEWMHIAEDYAKLNDLGQWGDLLDYYWDYQNDQPFYVRWH
jgi:endonuclease YncB( thermonuclease family)